MVAADGPPKLSVRRDSDMTFAAITPSADIGDSSAVALHIAETCLVDGPLGRVGLELEAHCHDPADPNSRPGWDEISAVLEALPPLPGGSAVTVEPGGAVELS